jgi:hypothetical protein
MNADSYEPPPPLFSSSTRYAYGVLRLAFQFKSFTCRDIDSSPQKIRNYATLLDLCSGKQLERGANFFACAQRVKM